MGITAAARPHIAAVFSNAARSPTTIQSARPFISGEDNALSTTSGPMPAGSPMVIAIRGVDELTFISASPVDERTRHSEGARPGLQSSRTCLRLANHETCRQTKFPKEFRVQFHRIDR